MSDAKKISPIILSFFFFSLKAKLQVLMFEFCQIIRMNLQFHYKILLKLDSKSSLLLEYGCNFFKFLLPKNSLNIFLNSRKYSIYGYKKIQFLLT